MSDKAKPFTKAEQDRLVEDQRKGMAGIDDPARWVATLLRVEVDNHDTACRLHEAWEELKDWKAALAEMTRERDAAMFFVSYWLDSEPIQDARERLRTGLAEKRYGQMHAHEWAAILAALDELPDNVVIFADAEDALWERKAASQPSRVSGGFAAAAGILKDTWDGEPSEVAIRRIRDGTPPPEVLP